MNRYLILSLLIVYALTSSVPGQSKNGLVGILYDDTKLNRISSVWYLESLDSQQAQWVGKNDFSAHWIGNLKMPYTGEITIIAEADNEIQISLDGESIIDTWEGAGKSEAKVIAKRGKSLPVDIKYRQINGESELKLYWKWNGHEKEIIPADAVFYTENQHKDMQREFESVFQIDYEKMNFDFESIIDIHSEKDALAKRNAVIDLLWGNPGFPNKKLPDAMEENIRDTNYAGLANLKAIDKLSVKMEYSLSSYVYHFKSNESNGKAAIYHQGHGGKFLIGINTIQALLSEGYDVYAMSMPLLGFNNKPIASTERFGKLFVHKHEYLAYLSPDHGHPVKYFMEPVAVVMNYMEQQNYEKIVMVGLSGGGWTTTLYAAIDSRIDISIPVAGSLPFYLRSNDLMKSGTIGDYEQKVPELYSIANYLELYVLGSFGKGRSQLQILNQFDACCFGGTGYKTYENAVKTRVNELGIGKYDFFLDSSHRLHQISPKAIEYIINYLQKN